MNLNLSTSMNEFLHYFVAVNVANFHKCACGEEYLKGNKHSSLHMTLKTCSHICPWTLSVAKTVRFLDKYAITFSRQVEASVIYKIHFFLV